MTAAILPSLFLWFAGGVAVGSLYWLGLHWSVARLAAGRSIALAIAVQLTRFAALGAALTLLAVRSGALALLVAAAGVMLARPLVVRLSTRG